MCLRARPGQLPFNECQKCSVGKAQRIQRKVPRLKLFTAYAQVVEENKRQLCVFEQAKDIGKPWLWWDFAGGYATRCTFAAGKFNDAACAQAEVEAVGLENGKVLACMADSSADQDHPLLQVSHLSIRRECSLQLSRPPLMQLSASESKAQINLRASKCCPAKLGSLRERDVISGF